ncbi:MAG: gamma-glutamyltransferase [Thermomicrobiales bacterium]|nr:gamma-glutamyltransferase [Thermomicrobiales bacterium]
MTTGPGNDRARFSRRRDQPFYADHGMVAAAHPLAVDAGLQVMHRGGNAFDVAVAAGLAAAVVMPEMCGLGGELFAVFTVAGSEPQSMQASGRSPRGATYEMMVQAGGGKHMPYTGPHSIAVPGMVDAYCNLLERFGTMSFAEVAQPAISLARDGFPLHPHGAAAIAANADLIARDEAAAAIFLANGHTPTAGMRLVQSDLSTTLETIASDGAKSFYSGSLAKRMVGYLKSIGGKFELADFADYTTDHSAPYSTTYRGYTVYQSALPSQGIIMLEALNILEYADLSAPQSVEAIHTMVEAKKLAYADRLAYLGDGARNPIQRILGKEFARDRYHRIDPSRANDNVAAGNLYDGDTTYLCTADDRGNMVSLIQSVSAAFGSGIVAGDTGVVMNNRSGRGFSLDPAHPNCYAPGKKSMHTLNAYLVANQQGVPVLVGGTPGGDGQPQWNLQCIVGVIDAGMDVQAAIEQPRWTSWPGTDPAGVHNSFELRVEARLPESVRRELVDRGHRIVAQSEWGGGGAVQMVARDPQTGLLVGGSDPRVEGMALGR